MGHSSIQVTVDIYGHLVPGANIAFADRLDGATCPQEGTRCQSEDFRQVLKNEWLGGRDSNPDTQIQSLQSYR